MYAPCHEFSPINIYTFLIHILYPTYLYQCICIQYLVYFYFSEFIPMYIHVYNRFIPFFITLPAYVLIKSNMHIWKCQNLHY